MSGTAPDEDGSGGDSVCRDDQTVEPGGRCDVYETDWYFEVDSSGTGCLRGVANICSGQSITWRSGNLTFIAGRNSDDSWTIDDVEPEPSDAAVAAAGVTAKSLR